MNLRAWRLDPFRNEDNGDDEAHPFFEQHGIDNAVAAAILTDSGTPGGLDAGRCVDDASGRFATWIAGGIVDALHPQGRCTCAGEGECDWCERIGNRLDDEVAP